MLLVLTEGLFRAELQCRCVDGEVGRRLSALSLGTGRYGGSRDSCAQRVDSWSSCDGATGVREVGKPPAARNCHGGPTHLRRRPGEIPALHGSGSRMAGSGGFLDARRSFCGGSQGWR